MRATTAFTRLSDPLGITVTQVQFTAAEVIVAVRGFGPAALPVVLVLDHGPLRPAWGLLHVAASGSGTVAVAGHTDLRRLVCPEYGCEPRRPRSPGPGPGSPATCQGLAGWLATTIDKSALCRLLRIDWDTIGRIIKRVMATELDPDRLERLFSIGVAEMSWRKGHSYLILVSDHATGRFVWGATPTDP